jgi:hypothetical protein
MVLLLENYPAITAQFAIYFDYFAKKACNTCKTG